jgi:hypothetical protein
MAKATAKRGYSLLLTAATVVTFPIAPLSWLPIWKHPRLGQIKEDHTGVDVACVHNCTYNLQLDSTYSGYEGSNEC